MAPLPIALTIAGSDSGGGAGIQADLKTFHQFGLFGTSVITAVTAQNTRGVRDWTALPPAMIAAQIDAVAEDLAPQAVKSGMLGERAVVGAVAERIRHHRLRPYVLDPVMVATSGDPLLTEEAIGAIRAELVPLADLVTPNLDEAALLTGAPVRTVADMEAAARALVEEHGARAALVKGGHLTGPVAVDILFDGALHRFEHPRLDTTSTHGTGCTLSSAIASRLALGDVMKRAVELSLDWVHEAIRTAPPLGSGHGPLNHFTPAPQWAARRERSG